MGNSGQRWETRVTDGKFEPHVGDLYYVVDSDMGETGLNESHGSCTALVSGKKICYS